MKIRQFWQFHGLNGWKYEKNLKKGLVCNEVPCNTVTGGEAIRVPQTVRYLLSFCSLFCLGRELGQQKTFFEITVQDL